MRIHFDWLVPIVHACIIKWRNDVYNEWWVTGSCLGSRFKVTESFTIEYTNIRSQAYKTRGIRVKLILNSYLHISVSLELEQEGSFLLLWLE
jgi:hypothetical protein